MSGHSKWSTIKRKKGAADAKRGKLFTKLSKEIQVSARLGGGDPDGNPRLRLAIQAARGASMPSDNINRAIKKGTGELGGDNIEELVYEGYGPGGVAFIMEVATDNQTRTIAEVRHIFDRSGGNLAKSGAVAFLFERRGMIRYEADAYPEERMMEAALEAGAEDVVTEDGQVVVYTEPNDLHAVKDVMDAGGFDASEAAVTMVPRNSVTCQDEDTAKKTIRLLDRLEEHEDVQNVWANFEIPESVLDRLEADS